MFLEYNLKERFSESKHSIPKNVKIDSPQLTHYKSPQNALSSPQANYVTGNTIAEFKIPSQVKSLKNSLRRGNTESRFIKQMTVSETRNKKSREKIRKRRPGESDKNQDFDSAINLTNTTTAHTANINKYSEDQANLMKLAKSLSKRLLNITNDTNKDIELNEIFQEIVNIDPFFGDALRQIKVIWENNNKDQAKEIEKLKIINETLQKENLSQKEKINEMEKTNVEQAEILSKKEEEFNKQVKRYKKQIEQFEKEENAKKEKVKSLTGDLNDLYNENCKLRMISKKLYYDLKQSKKREITLVELLKKKENPSESSSEYGKK